MPKNKKPHRFEVPSERSPKVEEGSNEVEPSPQEGTGASFSRRKIVNNWAKYEAKIVSEEGEHENSSIRDKSFSYLAENSTLDCHYFQLAAEKAWEKLELKPDDGLFSLDLKLLASGLACIPFYERIGIDHNLLLPENEKKCDSDAKASLLKYKPILDDRRKKSSEKNEPETCYDAHIVSTIPMASNVELHSSDVVSTISVRSCADPKVTISPELNVPCAETRSVQTNSVVSSKNNNVIVRSCENVDSSAKKPVEEDDLEDWLDSVLDK